MPNLVSRRELLNIASAAVVALAAGRADWAMPQELVQNVANAADWKPAFFSPHQNDTLIVLTELIIPRTGTPGANDAKVHRYMDLFMEAGDLENGKQFVDGLAWLDGHSKQLHNREFVGCAAGERTAMLESMAGADKDDPGRLFFDQLKGITAMIYFSTPEGYRELNRFGPPPKTVGCEHPEGHPAT